MSFQGQTLFCNTRESNNQYYLDMALSPAIGTGKPDELASIAYRLMDAILNFKSRPGLQGFARVAETAVRKNLKELGQRGQDVVSYKEDAVQYIEKWQKRRNNRHDEATMHRGQGILANSVNVASSVAGEVPSPETAVHDPVDATTWKKRKRVEVNSDIEEVKRKLKKLKEEGSLSSWLKKPASAPRIRHAQQLEFDAKGAIGD